MQSRDFCFWLQGLFELSQGIYEENGLNGEQVKLIQQHLQLVFVHEIDPSMGDQNHQNKLNDIHHKPPFPGSIAGNGGLMPDNPHDKRMRC